MSVSYIKLRIKLRSMLRSYGCGKSLDSLADDIGIDSRRINRALLTMPDAYISDWTTKTVVCGFGHKENLVPIWSVVEVPPYAPKPRIEK